jgi:hypothetical protein
MARILPVILFLQLTIVVAARSQTLKISGVVKDEASVPMRGATVSVKGTATSAMTDSSGKYVLSVPGAGSVLVFSYTGYEKTEIVAGHQSSIDVTLRLSGAALNDVVVIGYGTQKKADLTGAIATVSGADLNKRDRYRPDAAAAGETARTVPDASLGRGGE